MKTQKCFSGGPISWRPRPTSDRTFPRITICKLRIYYSKIEEAQRVCVFVAAEPLPNFRHSRRVRGGESPEAAASRSRKRPRAGHSGPLVGFLHATACRRTGERGCRVRRVGAEFRRVCPGGKLKNWKSEKLNPDRTRQDSRISGFQVFTRLQFHVAGEGGNSERLPSGKIDVPSTQKTSLMQCS